MSSLVASFADLMMNYLLTCCCQESHYNFTNMPNISYCGVTVHIYQNRYSSVSQSYVRRSKKKKERQYDLHNFAWSWRRTWCHFNTKFFQHQSPVYLCEPAGLAVSTAFLTCWQMTLASSSFWFGLSGTTGYTRLSSEEQMYWSLFPLLFLELLCEWQKTICTCTYGHFVSNHSNECLASD